MKFGQFLIGILLGALLSFGLTNFITNRNQPALKASSAPANNISSKWVWPDSLDALKAAPENHKLVYEDTNVRVLAVVLDGNKSEPIHTHKWRSVMWIAKPIVPCQITSFRKADNGKFIKSNSLLIKEMQVNLGQLIDAEGPTSITNLGAKNGLAYRVEFKRKFEP